MTSTSVKLSTSNTTNDSICFGIDSNGNYGYIKEGAATVVPFKNIIDLGSHDSYNTLSLDVSTYYSNYSSLTVDDFYLKVSGLNDYLSGSYNPNTQPTLTIAYASPNISISTCLYSLFWTGNNQYNKISILYHLYLLA